GVISNCQPPTRATQIEVTATQRIGDLPGAASCLRRLRTIPTPASSDRFNSVSLSVDFEGQHYTSTDSTRQVPRITALVFDLPNGGRYAGTDGLRAGITYTDTPNVRNYYLWEQYVNDVRQTGPDTTVKLRLIGNDLINDGLRVDGFQPYEGIDIPSGATVLVRQLAISEQMYRYYFALNDQLGSDGSPFAVPPASVRGNVQNTTNPSLPALGYFSVSEVSERRATRELPPPPRDSTLREPLTR
ncbi:MAG: DUF4249 family protein, partial [Gemmatimonadaceae bacterium]